MIYFWIAAHRLGSCNSQALEFEGFSSCGAWTWLLCGLWNLPRPGIEAVSPAGRLLSTALPGKSNFYLLYIFLYSTKCLESLCIAFRIRNKESLLLSSSNMPITPIPQELVVFMMAKSVLWEAGSSSCKWKKWVALPPLQLESANISPGSLSWSVWLLSHLWLGDNLLFPESLHILLGLRRQEEGT